MAPILPSPKLGVSRSLVIVTKWTVNARVTEVVTSFPMISKKSFSRYARVRITPPKVVKSRIKSEFARR